MKGDADLTTTIGSGLLPQYNENHDLKTFARNILNDVDSHNFNGDTKSLEESVNNLLKSPDQMVPQKFGEAKSGYENIGGMIVAIPGSEILDKKKVAEEIDPLPQMTSALESSLTKGHGVATKELLVNYLNEKVNSVADKMRDTYQKQFEQIQNGEDNIMLAGDEQAFAAAVADLKAKLSAMDHGQLGKAIHTLAPEVQKEVLAKPAEGISPNWDDFIKKMKSHTN